MYLIRRTLTFCIYLLLFILNLLTFTVTVAFLVAVHICFLQNEQILCGSDFMLFQNMRKSIWVFLGTFFENLGSGAELYWSTRIVSYSHICFIHFAFYRMEKYCLVLILSCSIYWFPTFWGPILVDPRARTGFVGSTDIFSNCI